MSCNRTHTFVNQRMMIGRKKPKKPEIAGGKTPEMNAKENGEDLAHESRKGTYVLNYTKKCEQYHMLE